MLSRVRTRKSVTLMAAVFGACFLVGLGGMLLSTGHGPGWLLAVWPWAPGGDPGPGTPTGPGEPGGDGDGDPGQEIVIVAGQVIYVPGGGGDGGVPRIELPDPPIRVEKVEPGGNKVAVTFDSGWEWQYTGPLLAVLRQYDLQVTFFPRGKWLEDNPELAQEILADGHEIGSHSYTHPDMTQLSAAELQAEIAQAREALLALGGPEAFRPYYRPPYGAHNETVSRALAEHGYGWVVMWQVDSLDWQTTASADAIVARVLDGLTDGGIALMHTGRQETIDAVPRIIEGLQARDLAIVKVSELLDHHFPGDGKVAYTVQAGDTLYSIARSHGTTVAELLAANPGLTE